MAGWSGTGVFTRLYSWVSDAAAGIDISSVRMDADTNLITTSGFGNCLTRDGQGAATANLPMNGFKHTNVGNGVDPTDYIAMRQLQTPGSLPLFATTITATGNVSVGGTLGVTGNTTLGGAAGITGNATIGGTLGVTGLISPASGVGVKGSLVALPAGSVGETIPAAAGASFAEATPVNLMQITLPTAGVWMVFANTILSAFSGATTMFQGILCVTKNSATLSAGVDGAYVSFNIAAGGVSEFGMSTGPFIIVTTGSTPIYAVGYVATLAASGGKHSNGLLTGIRIA